MFKRCKVVMLPTNEKASNCICLFGGSLFLRLNHIATEYQHLYILSYEKIEDGDWYIEITSIGGLLHQATKESLNNWKSNAMSLDNFNRRCKKVIAATDSSLIVEMTKIPVIPGIGLTNQYHIKNSLPSPSQSFIEEYASEYNKGNKIEEVMVEYDVDKTFITAPNSDEKLTAYVHYLKLNPDNTINIKSIKDSWTREEVIELCENAYDSGRYSIIHKDIEQTFDKWIETNL